MQAPPPSEVAYSPGHSVRRHSLEATCSGSLRERSLAREYFSRSARASPLRFEDWAGAPQLRPGLDPLPLFARPLPVGVVTRRRYDCRICDRYKGAEL